VKYYKGGDQMESKRQRMTLLLDDKTIKALKQYSYEKLGDTNVSKAVMLMVKEHGTKAREDT